MSTNQFTKCADCGKSIYKYGKTGKCGSCFQIGNKKAFGKKRTVESKKRYSLSKMGSKNPMWKGDGVGFRSIHEWVRRRYPKPDFCIDCKIVKPMDLANISQKYKRDIRDWEWLCRKCHMTKDGRLLNFKNLHKK